MKIKTHEDKITILLATYNGEMYIAEQLNSIISQSYINWEVWVSDDNSEDNTLGIVKKYCDQDNRINILYNTNEKNLGPCMNFNQLCLNVSLANYIMFCDQDDIWFPNKIDATYNLMKEKEKNSKVDQPILVFTDFNIVDENLNVLSESGYDFINVGEMFFRKPLNTLLSFNFAWGCTLMCNKNLIKKCIPIPQNAENHDFWIALVSAAVGKMYFLNIPTMFYRQHSSNVTGMYDAKQFNSRIRRLFNGWSRMDQKITNSKYHASCLIERFSNEITLENLALLNEFVDSSNQSGFKLCLFAMKNNIKRPRLISTLFFYLNLIMHKEYNANK